MLASKKFYFKININKNENFCVKKILQFKNALDRARLFFKQLQLSHEKAKVASKII